MNSPFHSLKQFIRTIEYRIPKDVKTVAELRLQWADIVGERMAARSQVSKCEYLPKKDENGHDTGAFHKRLVVLVKDSITQTAMTEYASMYLDNLPKKYHIHSLRFQYTHKEFSFKEDQYIPQKPNLVISVPEKQKIITQVQSYSMNEDTKKALVDYLVVCQSLKNKKDNLS